MSRAKPASPDVKVFADHEVITQPNPLRDTLHRLADGETDDAIARAEQALSDLAGDFTNWMAIECERLATAHAAIRARGFSHDSGLELFRAAHDIKGDAATFGYPLAAAAAESLCRIIEHAPKLDEVPHDLIAHHIHAIQAIVRENAKDGSRIGVELARRLRSAADDFLIGANQDRPEHLEAVTSPSLAPAIVEG